MHQASNIGLIGLGVMGRNLALNMADHGFTVTATDPWPEARQSLVTELARYPQPERIRITPGVAELVAALPAPRSNPVAGQSRCHGRLADRPANPAAGTGRHSDR